MDRRPLLSAGRSGAGLPLGADEIGPATGSFLFTLKIKKESTSLFYRIFVSSRCHRSASGWSLLCRRAIESEPIPNWSAPIIGSNGTTISVRDLSTTRFNTFAKRLVSLFFLRAQLRRRSSWWLCQPIWWTPFGAKPANPAAIKRLTFTTLPTLVTIIA